MEVFAIKGMVFTEFFEMVDEKFSMDMSERLIEMSDLPSGGVYTAVGTYDTHEMEQLVSNLSEVTGIPVPDLLKAFGRYLFDYFLASFPTFFEGIESTAQFLPRINDYVHVEVKKLYSDAEVPIFKCEEPTPGTIIMTYKSKRNLPDLAEGLIMATIDHFKEQLVVEEKSLGGDPPETQFTIRPQ